MTSLYFNGHYTNTEITKREIICKNVNRIEIAQGIFAKADNS